MRGGLQPDHHGPSPVSGPGIPPGRDDSKLRHGAESIPSFRRASTGWPSTSRSSQNFGNGQQWKFYYLYGLERAGRLTGLRFFGKNDWYRLGAEELVHEQNKFGGFWVGALNESDKVLATSFALLFLAKGRAPVLINKLVHAPSGDWNNDPDDVRNIVNVVSRDWKSLLTWQVVDPGAAALPELLQAPIIFFNGHHAPQFSADAPGETSASPSSKGVSSSPRRAAAASEFDQGFKQLMTEIFPEPEYQLRPLSRRPSGLAGQALALLPTSIRSGGSSTAAARSSSTRPRTSRATGTSPRHRRPTPA